MAKYSRALSRGLVIAALLGIQTAAAAGAPPDRALVALSETLRFKLERPLPPDAATWARLVNETAFMADRLGLLGEAVVAAQQSQGRYMVLVAGRGVIAGRDPDQVLGRFLYFLATDDHAAAFAAPIAISDQALTATLAHLRATLN